MNAKGARTPVLLLAALLTCAIALPAIAEQQLPEGWVGTDKCVDCHDHEDMAISWPRTAHGASWLANGGGTMGCESCHGPGEEHTRTKGKSGDVVMPAELDATEQADLCAKCHSDADHAFWRGSDHETFGVTCTDCHDMHAPWTNQAAVKNATVTGKCIECHADKRKGVFSRSHHPLREGVMSCATCHDPHGSQTESALTAITKNELCYDCHSEKRGPFAFEHQPVREDCGTCHDPHGSVHASMLIKPAPRLCQSCHLLGHHQTVPGTPNQMWNTNRSCVNCHANIHGSNHPSGIIFKR